MRWRKKSRDDLEAALVTHLPAIWRFALSLSGRPDLADDLAQATCARALDKAEQFRADNSPVGWLLTICRSLWLNGLRADAVRRTGGMETAAPEDLIDRTPGVETNIFAAQVYTRIMALPEAQRATVELVYVQQFTYREAAAILDVPIGTVMSRLATARAVLAPLGSEADTGSAAP